MAIKLRTLVKHPSRLEGSAGITITKENGVYTAALDLAEFAEVVSIVNESATTVLLVTEGAAENGPDVVERISVDNLISESDAVLETRQVISGAGLTGGGDLSADRTLVVGAGPGITVNANDVALDTSSTRNTDHTEVVLTAGAGLAGGGDISVSRSFAVGAGAGILVNADDVALDTSSTRNTDHSVVTLTAGAGLTGGGDISGSRSFAVGAGTGIAVNADDVALAAIGDGRIMANVSGGAAAPGEQTLSAVLDVILGNTQGGMVTRNATAWVKLDPGANGHFLRSNGAGADIGYAAVPGGGDLLAANNLSDVANADTARDNLNAELKFASGTSFLCFNATAPTGYTKDTSATFNDKALRLVTGTPGTGGSSPFSTVFAKTATDGTTLTNSHLPTSIGGATTATEYSITSGESAVGTNPLTGSGGQGYPNSGGGNAHTHPMDIRVQYVDAIKINKT